MTPSETEATIIVPIFNLSHHRFNNFCFVVSKLANLGCKVIVCEQTSDRTSHTEQVLLKYPTIQHIITSNKSSSFNKSELINAAAYNTSTEYLWIVDADFYTDYEYVLKNIPRPLTEFGYDVSCDFIRPFSQVVFLTEDESSQLITTNELQLNEDAYETNSQDAKFSFIVSRTRFLEAGGMNTDFVGWGFQDLDFLHNRLQTTATRGVVNQQAYHLYHKRASRKSVNYNRQLYINYGGRKTEFSTQWDGQLTNTTQYRGTIITESAKKSQKNPIQKLIPKPTQVEGKLSECIPTTSPKAVIARKSWPTPTRGIFYSSRSNTFKCLNSNIIKTSDSLRTILKSTSHGLKKISASKPFIHHYIQYIKNSYDNIHEDDVILFVNDTYVSQWPSVKQMNTIMEKVNTGRWERFPKNTNFTWLKKTKLGSYKGESVKYSPSCCFIVTGSVILKRPKDYYENLVYDIGRWDESQLANASKLIPTIFT